MTYLYRIEKIPNLGAIAQNGLQCGAAGRTSIRGDGLPQETFEARDRGWPIPPPPMMDLPRVYFFVDLQFALSKMSRDPLDPHLVIRVADALVPGLRFPDGMIENQMAIYAIYPSCAEQDIVVQPDNIEIHDSGTWVPAGQWLSAQGSLPRRYVYVNSPLDSEYLFPVSSFANEGDLPPEDWAVRKAAIAYERAMVVQAFYRDLETKDMTGIKNLLSNAEKNGMVSAPFYDKEFIVSDAATAPGSQWTFFVSPEKLENNLRVELPLVKDMVCDSLNSYVSERLNGNVGDLNSISCEKGRGGRGNVLVAVSTVRGLIHARSGADCGSKSAN